MAQRAAAAARGQAQRIQVGVQRCISLDDDVTCWLPADWHVIRTL
jgi:hypothetical protein